MSGAAMSAAEARRPGAGISWSGEMSATATRSDASLLGSAGDTPLAYIVIVLATDAKARRRPFLSLHSAEKAVERAHARGHAASLHLCYLVPVPPPMDAAEVA